MALTTKTHAMMNNPYRTIPSKKGSFPKGVLKGQVGSRIKEVYLKNPARSTTQPVNINKTSNMEEFSSDKIDQSFLLYYHIFAHYEKDYSFKNGGFFQDYNRLRNCYV